MGDEDKSNKAHHTIIFITYLHFRFLNRSNPLLLLIIHFVPYVSNMVYAGV